MISYFFLLGFKTPIDRIKRRIKKILILWRKITKTEEILWTQVNVSLGEKLEKSKFYPFSIPLISSLLFPFITTGIDPILFVHLEKSCLREVFVVHFLYATHNEKNESISIGIADIKKRRNVETKNLRIIYWIS